MDVGLRDDMNEFDGCRGLFCVWCRKIVTADFLDSIYG